MHATHHTKPVPFFALPLLWLVVSVSTLGAQAQDLSAAADGEHLWLVVDDPDAKPDPRLLVYHLALDAGRGQMVLQDKPIEGELMPRGLAAGDGRLLIVLADRRLREIRPSHSELLDRWVYQTKSLPALPEGCTLVALATGHRGPWALVRVESADTLAQLDQAGREPIPDDLALKRALGLPDNIDLSMPGDDGAPPTGDAGQDKNDDAAVDPENTHEVEQADDAAEQDSDDTQTAPARPTYRLIHLHQSRWSSTPLPEGFSEPKHAALILRQDTDDPRPTILIEPAEGPIGGLTRYTPLRLIVEPDPGTTADDASPQIPREAWTADNLRPRLLATRGWSAAGVAGQVVVAVERTRSDQTLAVDTFLLRQNEPVALGRIELPTQGQPRWKLVPLDGQLAVVARPGPPLRAPAEGVEPVTPLGGLKSLTLGGEVVRDSGDDNGIVVLYEIHPSPLESNADQLIQILAFMSAMITMMLFYRRAPRGDQLDLPENLVLATFSRRVVAGFIDLAPGFLIAALVYDVSFEKVVTLWPGNGVPKPPQAMRPGLLVIAITVAHTTAFEFITARSIGKWMTGLYVADLSGKPAPPIPSLVRALSRVFDLFAPLMLVLMVISPGRQRLGDVLAKTLVVMRLPEEKKEQPDEPFDDDF